LAPAATSTDDATQSTTMAAAVAGSPLPRLIADKERGGGQMFGRDVLHTAYFTI
jgi:hypothetical protein